jgi:hypothetical protein
MSDHGVSEAKKAALILTQDVDRSNSAGEDCGQEKG